MNLMKPLTLFAGLFVLTGFAAAQTDNPLTITGGAAARTQLNLADGTGYANLASGPGSQTFLKFANKIDKFSTVVFKLGAPYLDDKSGAAYDTKVAAANSWLSGVGVQEAYGTTDILGELGMNQLIGLKLQAGMFHLKAPMFSRGLNFGLGTGDEGSRAEIFGNYGGVGSTFTAAGFMYESYKWSLEVPFNVLKDSFPLSIKVGSDLDLTGKGQNTGFTGYAEVAGRNLYLIDDQFVVDWVVYSALKARDKAPAGTSYLDNGKVFGGSFDLGFGFEGGPSFGLGASADYALYDYKGTWEPAGIPKDYSESDLNYEVGLDVSQKDLAKVSGAYVHRNFFDLAASTPSNYAQNFVAFRADVTAFGTVTPYAGGTYVLGYETVKDSKTKKLRGAAPSGYDSLSWEAGVMWALTNAIELDCGYTKGDNHALATFGAVINAIEPSKDGALFVRAGWKF